MTWSTAGVGQAASTRDHDLALAKPGRRPALCPLLLSMAEVVLLRDPVQRRATVPAKGGAETLVAVARRLDDAGIELDDLGLRRPSLDDVFMR